MQDSATMKRIVAAWVTICMIVSSLGVMILAADNETNNSNGLMLFAEGGDMSTTGSIEFEGFELKFVTDAQGNNSIQALVDVYVKDVDPTGVTFTLKYDKNFIVPSEYATNAEINSLLGLADSSFEPNTSYFAKPTAGGTGLDGDLTVEGYLDTDTNSGVTSDIVTYLIRPNGYKDTSQNTYIGKSQLYTGQNVLQDIKTILATKVTDTKGMKIGTLSFRIIKPNQVVSQDQNDPAGAAFLANMLSLYEKEVNYNGTGSTTKANIIYVDSATQKEYFISALDATWNVKDTLYSVTPTVTERTVSAYNVYMRAQTGTVDDLITYLNQEMGSVFMNYTSGVQRLSRFVWSKTDPSFSITPNVITTPSSYNPRGDVIYTVSQYCDQNTTNETQNTTNENQNATNENMKITVKVTVTPVIVTGLLYDNQVKTFIDPNRPAAWSDLVMPAVIIPVLDGIDDMYVVPTECPGQSDWNPQDVTDSLKYSPAPVSEKYTHTFNKDVFGTPTSEPWLTMPTDSDFWDVKAIRNVLPTGAPMLDPDKDTVTARVERLDGELVITVPTIYGGAVPSPVPDFNIYLPDGTALNTLPAADGGNGDFVTVTTDSNGYAVITVKTVGAGITSKSQTELDRIQSIINLGSSGFKLTLLYKDTSATPAVYYEGSQVPFTFDPRVNFYLPETKEGNKYYDVKNYSQSKMNQFPVYENTALADIPTYISFPDSQTIPVRFNGQTGYQITSVSVASDVDSSETTRAEQLSAAKVVSWEYWEDATTHVTSTGPLPVYDTDIYLVGKLADYSYSNFGDVQNPDPYYNVYLRLKVTTQPDPNATPTPDPNASPSPTPDPNASPSPSPDPNASPSPTPQPVEGVRILTMAHGTVNGVYNNGGVELELNGKTFEYDTKTVGYTPSDVQTQVYKIENIGTSRIWNPTLRIADFKYTPLPTDTNPTPAQTSGPVSYIIGDNGVYSDDLKNLANSITPNILEITSGGEAYFDIRTKCQLPVGIYTATVYVGSMQNSELGSFEISFKVVDKEVYRVTIQNDDDTKGKGYLMDSDSSRIYSNTYLVGDTVNLFVEIVDIGYTLEKWEEIIDPSWTPPPTDSVSFNPAIPTGSAPFPTTFTMLGRDVIVKPEFRETTYNQLRPSDLRDYNNELNATPNPLRPDSIANTPAPYSETTFLYYVIVEGDKDQNYIQIDLKPVNFLRTVTMTLTNSDVSDYSLATAEWKTADTNGVYIWSNIFDLAPGENRVVIRISYDNDPTIYQEYTVVIYRKQNVDVTMRPGNSPVGLIWDDSTWSDTDKQAIEAAFRASGTNYYTYDPSHPPDKAVNTMYTRYSTAAWTNTNYDLDKTALFVYQGEKFVDPGYSRLKKTGTGDDVQPEELTRTIKGVYVYATPIPATDSIAKTMKNAALYNGTGDIAVASVTAAPANYDNDGRCLIEELSSLAVRPGAYTMEYSFKDSDGSTATFQRPVIVLAKKGDVNLSGDLDRWLNVVTNAYQSNDADILYQRLNDTTDPTVTAAPASAPAASDTPATPTPVPTHAPAGDGFFAGIINNTSEEWAQLFAYRIGDVTEDINVNSIDANAILNKYDTNPAYNNATVDIALRQYYEPLPQQLSDVMPTFDPSQATPAPTEVPLPTATPKPVLALDYLGTGSGPQNTKQTPNLSENNEYGKSMVNANSTVWVGIGIRNTENLEYFLDGLYSVDFAIDYDPEIFEPTDANYRIKSDTGFDIASVIESRNLNSSSMSGVDTSHATLWYNAELYTQSLQSDLWYPHADVAEDKYRTLFVTIKSPDGQDLRLHNYIKPTPSPGTSSAADDETIYLLRVPFRLKKYPNLDASDPNRYTGNAITLNLTENTFVLGATDTGVTNSASWEGQNKDKTTEVNNAYNHFDLDIVDIFNTGGTFDITGTLSGWNPQQPFKVEFFKTDFKTGEVDVSAPEYTFESTEMDPQQTDKPRYGPTTIEPDGHVTWEYKLPVSNLFDYTMVITKMSHLTYPEQEIKREDDSGNSKIAGGTYDEVLTDELVVGDLDDDGFIKVPDRVGLIRLFNEQKPWWDKVFPQTDPRVMQFRQQYEEADLNGDDTVNLFDLNLLNQNMNENTVTAYPQPTPTTDP